MSIFNFNPPLIAHRGASSLAPENTLAAFKKAYELGARWLEFDVMLTADKVPVVIHDDTLERTTCATGRVCDYPYSYIKTLDAGTWFDPSFSKEKIPSLSQVIAFLREHPMQVNVELKSQEGFEEEVAVESLKIINEEWKDLPPPLISSFSMQVLHHVRYHSKDALLGILIHDWFSEWEDIADRLNCITVDINHKLLDYNQVARIKSMNKDILTYTVNDVARAKELFLMGADAVFTDKLPEMMKVF